jgi:hypothetical protein
VKSWIRIRIKNDASAEVHVQYLLHEHKGWYIRKTHLEFFISEGKFQFCLLILHEGEDQVVVPAKSMGEY